MNLPEGQRPLHFQYVPAIDLSRLLMAAAGPAHGLLVDLEDGVLPAMKESARRVCADFLTDEDMSRRSIVRMNELDSQWAELDLRAVAQSVTTLLVPKISSAEQLESLDGRLVELEREMGREVGSIGLFVILETAAAVLDVGRLATATPRVRGLVLGQADLTVDLGCSGVGGDGFVPSPMLDWAHAQVVYAAVAHGLPIYVSPWVTYSDVEERECEMRRLLDLGYTGMVVYDAEGVESVELASRPTASQEAFARAAIEAHARAAAQGEGKSSYRGWTIEGSYAQIVRRVVDRADRD